MAYSLLKDVFLFLIVAFVIAIAFTFTNCGENGDLTDFDLEIENHVFVQYTDGAGSSHIRKTEFKQADGDIYIDGDVLVGSAQEISIGQSVYLNHAVKDVDPSKFNDERKFLALKSHRAKIWPLGEVPFFIDEGMSALNKESLLILIDEFNELLTENKINLQIVPRVNEKDYINFLEMDESFPSGGQSYIGRIGGAQALKIREDNFSKTIVHHELLHALGFKHEHQRSDRKLKINFSNINKSQKFNFSMYNAGASIGKYDHESIMHYHSYAFSKNGEVTMLGLDGNLISRNRKLSSGDIYSLREIYGTTELLADGIYTYKGKTYSLSAGKYCVFRTHGNDLKLINMSLAEYSTMKAHGVMSSLKLPPYCDK